MWSFLSEAALMVTEVTLISLWYHALIRILPVSFASLFLILLTVVLGSYLIVRAMERLRWGMGVRRMVILVWLAAAAFGTLKIILYPATAIPFIDLIALPVRFIILPDVEGTSFFHLLLMLLLVSRGVSMASRPVSLHSIQISFQLWLILLLLYGIAFAPLYPRIAAVGLYCFLFFGLISMSAARISELGEIRGGRSARFGRGWLLSILFSGLVIVGLAVFTGWLASSRIVELIVRAFIFVFTILTAALMFLFTPLFVFLGRFIPQILDRVGNLLRSIASLELPQFLEDLTVQIGQVLEKAIPFIFAGRGLILLALVILVVFIIMFGLRLRQSLPRNDEEEEENAVSAGQDGSQKANWLRKLFQEHMNFRLRSPAQMLAAARIRSIYRQMMALSEKMGAPRPASITPLEFLPRLETLFPEEQAGVDRITQAYVKVRYGEYPETMQEVEEVQAAWDSLRKLGKKKLAAFKRSNKA
jgi:Na+-transporting methylmalonyl-CoA/oxaloacetate decarboxylase gamma subunit